MVTRIYQAVQWRQDSGFHCFRDFVSNAHNDANADESRKILGEICQASWQWLVWSVPNGLVWSLGGQVLKKQGEGFPLLSTVFFFCDLQELSDEMFKLKTCKRKSVTYPFRLGSLFPGTQS